MTYEQFKIAQRNNGVLLSPKNDNWDDYEGYLNASEKLAELKEKGDFLPVKVINIFYEEGYVVQVSDGSSFRTFVDDLIDLI